MVAHENMGFYVLVHNANGIVKFYVTFNQNDNKLI